ncbi:MAG: bifunctional phosphoribosyl-AMP cyclohydrolase/phosphoribosyl-ATP diphosphatase HisIE [Leptospirales bacterium]
MESSDRPSQKDGLVPAIVQNWSTGRVLMLGYMNQESLEKTRATGRVTFYSRSRSRIWEKGETSGNYLQVVEIREDCDQDALLILARPAGPTCHTGAVSCFDDPPGAPLHDMALPPFETWSELLETIRIRKDADPSVSYTASLLKKPEGYILKKVQEESSEVLIASLSESRERQVSEWADLLFHIGVALVRFGLSWEEVMTVLEHRRGVGGLREKQGRTEKKGGGGNE